MSDTNGPVLVLGASGALGSRIASALIGQGHGVIGTSSTAESVARIPVAVQGRVVADLADAASCAALVAHVAGTYPSLSGIVIASGVVGFAPAESTPVD